MMSLIVYLYVVVAIALMVVIGNLTGAITLIKALSSLACLGFYATDLLYGATMYLAIFCRVGWWKWLLLVAMAIIEVGVRNVTGVTSALSVIPRWHQYLFSNSIYLVGTIGALWVKTRIEEK